MANPVIYGPSFSTYVRVARLALEEKGQAYELVEVKAMQGEHKQPAHLARHPFGKVPAFEHDGFVIYETQAITRYIDQAFKGPSLTPGDARKAARMNQIIGVIDSYANDALIGKLVVQRLVVPMAGGKPDETIIAGCLHNVRLSLAQIEKLAEGGTWMAGEALSLADIHFAPIAAYVKMTPEGSDLLAPHEWLRGWWERMEKRPSMAATAPKFG